MSPNRDFWEILIMICLIMVLAFLMMFLLQEEKDCHARYGVYVRTFYGFECLTVKQARERQERKQNE